MEDTLSIATPYDRIFIYPYTGPKIKNEKRICQIAIDNWDDNGEDEEWVDASASIILDREQIQQIIGYLQKLIE